MLAAATAAPLVACGGGGSGGTQTLNWYIFPEPSGAFDKAAADCSRQSGGRYRIVLRALPSSADGQRQQMVRRLAAKDSALDILGLDVVWPVEFAEAGWIEPWTGRRAEQVRAGTLGPALDTTTWKGQTVAATLNTNTQLLWYRKDLVATPPRTWDEMIRMAEDLARQGKPHYVEIQGNQYEGYTVWFNSVLKSAGGNVLSEDGQQVVLGGEAARLATETIGRLARSVAADPSLPVQQEDQNRLAFESGTAAFQLNYPFIYPSAQKNAPDLAKKIGWTLYPRVRPDEPSHPTIGGIDLAVSAYSKHKEQAFDAIVCLRNRDNQLRNAIDGGLPPTLESLYTDPRLVKGGYPFAAEIAQSLRQASVRPKTPAYQSVSIAISSTLHPPSSVTPAKIPTLRGKIKDAVESKGLIP